MSSEITPSVKGLREGYITQSGFSYSRINGKKQVMEASKEATETTRIQEKNFRMYHKLKARLLPSKGGIQNSFLDPQSGPLLQQSFTQRYKANLSKELFSFYNHQTKNQFIKLNCLITASITRIKRQTLFRETQKSETSERTQDPQEKTVSTPNFSCQKSVTVQVSDPPAAPQQTDRQTALVFAHAVTLHPSRRQPGPWFLRRTLERDSALAR